MELGYNNDINIVASYDIIQMCDKPKKFSKMNRRRQERELHDKMKKAELIAAVKMERKEKQDKIELCRPIPKSHKVEMYARGEGISGVGVKNKIIKKKLENKEKKYEWAAQQSAMAEILLTEESGQLIAEEGERTSEMPQSKISRAVDIMSAAKCFDLQLQFGPYRMNFTRNGRHLLLGGRKGHVAAFDWLTKKLHCEMNVMEEVFDIQWLHVETMFAIAQKKWVYIYDNTGMELHCLKILNKVLRMEFLPYHFLLATSSEEGYLSWLDVSIGSLVSQWNTHQGRLSVLTHNPYNAVLCTGHTKGTVYMWTPNVREPVVKMLCHKTTVNSVAVDSKGLYMATSGVDGTMNVWDVRKFNGPLQKYCLHSVPTNLAFSQKGFLSVALGNCVEVYDDCCVKKAKYPYMRHRLQRTVGNLQFCQHEDVLGITHQDGYSSILVPGCGEPNIDALECNPFQTKKQRQEVEVKALLEKIQPEMITLDPFDIVKVYAPTTQDELEVKNAIKDLKPSKIDFTPRNKKRKINSATVKQIVRQQHEREFRRLNKEKLKKEETSKSEGKNENITESALDRFKQSKIKK